MPRRSQNEIIRFGAALAEMAGVDQVPESKLLGTISGITKSTSSLMREAFVKGVLDKVLQDKVRNLMKWVIHNQFDPQFVHDVEEELPLDLGHGAGLLDLKAVKPDGDRIPLRMFNVDTGSLEEWIFGDINYCILSHSWKGSEIVFPFLQAIKSDVREKTLFDEMITQAPDEDTRKFAKVQSAKYFHLHSGFSDVQLIRIQCLKDLDDQTRKIIKLLSADDHTEVSTSFVLDNEASFTTDDIFKLRCEAFEKAIGNRRDAILPHLLALVTSKTTGSEDWSQTKRAHPATAKAIEQLLPTIERIRSLQKIEQSLFRTKEILDSGLFNPVNKGRRYLWNDTICINKQDANELNHSLAMMGEWYSGAEFCLIQIDTPVNEWVETFKHLDKPHVHSRDSAVLAVSGYGHGLYNSFDELYEANPRPKWATRGWTLQELVLPKMAMFVNSVWDPLPRPVEALGPYYYLTAFLAEHVRIKDELESLHDLGKLQQVMDDNQIPYIEFETGSFQGSTLSSSDVEWTKKVRRLIGLLDFFGVDFSKNMNEDTAEALINQAINTAARSQIMIDTRVSVMKAFGLNKGESEEIASPEAARTFILLLLKALVREAEGEVHQDRIKMSRFGSCPSDECCRGFRRSHNSAQNMLSLAAFRECTVATDRVYSLMGVLGVQFGVFHAEGMTKALSRMLDEVVTTTNDVSVFNWKGRDFGSPLRGRSLYPSALEAYDPRKKVDGVALTAAESRFEENGPTSFQQRKYDLQLTSKKLTLLLNALAKFISSRNHRSWDPEPVRDFLHKVKEQQLDILGTQVNVMSKVLSFFEAEVPEATVANGSTENIVPPNEPQTPASTVSPPTSPPPTAAEAATGASKTSRFGIKAPKVPSLSSMSPKMPSLPSPSLPSMASFVSGKSDASKTERPALVSRKSAKMSEVHGWLLKTKTLEEGQMDEPVKTILDGIPAKSLATLEPQRPMLKKSKRLLAEDAVAPNPIVITTAGIQGFFDVQRVIIHIKDPDVLRQKAKNAASQKQKTNGSCRVSTAVASLEVDFRCTAEQLIKQINVCDVVYATIYGRQSEIVTTNESISTTEQHKQIERALDFVEEPQLNMIAGEWVLARFSGAPAAKWFLSTFELSTNNSFYGVRIPTSEIDFASVEPEKSLVEPWREYMENKKDVMYEVVEKQFANKDTMKVIDQIDERLRHGDDGDDDDDEEAGTLQSLIGKTASIAHQATGMFYERETQRLEAALNDEALKSIPKRLRAAIMTLNDNEELLPAMFVSDVMIHMF